MKRKLDDTLPPAKKRKLDHNNKIEPEVIHDPSIIIPKLKVISVQNGIVQISFLNIEKFYEQEIATNSIYEFELLYKLKNGEWKSVSYLNHEISCYEYFYLKVLVDIEDYDIQFKLRSKLKDSSNDKWSLFCDIISIRVPSSLIAHQFSVGDYVEFRGLNEYYSREGKIVKILKDNHVRIRPFPNHFLHENNHNNHNNDNNDTSENEQEEDDLTWHQYADLDYFFPLNRGENDGEETNDDDDDDGDILMNVLERIGGFDDERMVDQNRLNSFRRYLMKNRKRKRCHDIDIHTSRLYGDGIRLPSVIDITNNQINVDKMILLRTNNNDIIEIYKELNKIFYKNYALKYVDSYNYDNYDDKYQLKYIARFIGKNVCEFLMNNDNDYQSLDRFKWKIMCLRESNDGKMKLNPVRRDIINARICGLKDKIDKMNLYDIDNIIGFCDLCRLEISDYDFRFNCDQHITNKHDICITCTYNCLNQYIQLNHLLYPLLKNQLNDDCIQQITNFVVGSIVKL